MKKRTIYRKFNRSEIEFLLLGNNIKTHLQNCNTIYLMAISLGEVDEELHYLSYADPVKALFLESLYNETAESAMDELELTIKQPDKLYTTRYSPGYGDFPLSVQQEIVRILDSGRKIGLTVTDTKLLVPRKSITALMGER
jgi:hypothetical protein